MVIAIGLSSYNVALFHLINHAFYKALLFLGAGSVIHAVADNQDFRKFGGLISYLPLTYSVMLIASLSLVAFPFMTGFYSKDFILESAYGQFSFSGVAVYIIATIGAIFTTLYSVKVLYLTFLANPNGPRAYYRLAMDNLFSGQVTQPAAAPAPAISYKPAHEGDFFLTLPLVILALFSIFFGFITKDIFIGLGSNFFVDNSLFIHPIHEIMIDTEFAVPVLFKLLPFIFTISFSIIALTLSELLSELVICFKLSRFGYNIFGFFNQRFLIEFFYNKYITNLILNLGGQITKILDNGSIEFFGPFGLERGLVKLSKNISSLSTSHVTTYALYILVGFILYILYLNSPFYNLALFLIIILLIMISNGESESENGGAIAAANPRGINNKLKGASRKQPAINYIYSNNKMFSTSARFLNPSGNGNPENNSESAGDGDSQNNSGSTNGSNPNAGSGSTNGSNSNTGSDAAQIRQELLNAMIERDNLGREYVDLNNEHSEYQNSTNIEDREEEAEQTDTKEFTAKRLRNADDNVAKLHKELKDKTGQDVQGASAWSSEYPSERGNFAYNYFEGNTPNDTTSNNPTTDTTANQPTAGTIASAANVSPPTTNDGSPEEESFDEEEFFAEEEPFDEEESFDEENSNNKRSRSDSPEENSNNKRSRSDSPEEEYPSKRQKLDNNGKDDNDGSDDSDNDGEGGSNGPLNGNDGTGGGDIEGGNPSDANRRVINCLPDKDDLENYEQGDIDIEIEGLDEDDWEVGYDKIPLPPRPFYPGMPGGVPEEIWWEDLLNFFLDFFL